MSIKIYILINYIIDYMINIIKNYNDIYIYIKTCGFKILMIILIII